jgi:hypothetical protein
VAQTWTQALDSLVSDWDGKHIVFGNDVDGFLSAAIVCKATGASVAGVYTTSNLLLFDGASKSEARDALWLDLDINDPGIRCIGQHVVSMAAGDRLSRHPRSFNPNLHFGQHFGNSFGGKGFSRHANKYPFATAHLLLQHFGVPAPPPRTKAHSLLAHADGAWAVAHGYQPNGEFWLPRMFPDSPLMQDYVSGAYTADEANLAMHQKVKDDLLALGISSRRSESRTNVHIPVAWQEVKGHQTLPYAATTAAATWMPKFKAMAAYVSATMGWSLPVPAALSSATHCDVDTVRPEVAKKPTFDAWLASNDVFSYAIKDIANVRFTKRPVL